MMSNVNIAAGVDDEVSATRYSWWEVYRGKSHSSLGNPMRRWTIEFREIQASEMWSDARTLLKPTNKHASGLEILTVEDIFQ